MKKIYRLIYTFKLYYLLINISYASIDDLDSRQLNV